MKSIPEIAQAVERANAGTPINLICRQTGIDKKTLGVYLSRYRTDKDGAFQRRSYPEALKQEIVNKHFHRDLSAPLLSADYGIPAITIRRWIERYSMYGNEGLRDGRHKEKKDTTPEKEEDIMTVGRIITVVLENMRGSTDEDVSRIPQDLVSKGAFRNPEFGSFLVWVYDIGKLIMTESDRRPEGENRFTEEEGATILTTAKMLLMMVPYKGTRRREAETLIEDEGAKIFIQEFIDRIPMIKTEI